MLWPYSMRTLRSSARIVLLALLMFLVPEVRAEAMRTTFFYHDGVPIQHIPIDGWYQALGTFYYPTDYGRLYQITTFSFYHGYNYPPPQVGYEYRLFLVYRNVANYNYFVVDVYPREDLPPLATTCNYCWEEITIPWWGLPVLYGGDTENAGLGLFVRPENDDELPPSADYPFLWIDAMTDYPLTTALLRFNTDDYDISNVQYSEIGELLIDIEITYMDETATDESTFSRLKRLWSPPYRDE